MLAGVAHLHFREGERGPQEATLGFEEAMTFLENRGIEEVVATFHLRHPADLRLATPQPLLAQIEEYDGNVKIHLMPEANLVFEPGSGPGAGRISHDIDFWKRLALDQAAFEALLTGWIVSAHFTAKLGWSKTRDADFAPEQTYGVMAALYREIMEQTWPGWIGHPFQWCTGNDIGPALESLLAAAIDTNRMVEIPIKPVRKHSNLTLQTARRSIPLFRPDLIAKFGASSRPPGAPLVAISLDAHHLPDLEYGLENAARVAGWLIEAGVQPAQIWGWQT